MLSFSNIVTLVSYFWFLQLLSSYIYDSTCCFLFIICDKSPYWHRITLFIGFLIISSRYMTQIARSHFLPFSTHPPFFGYLFRPNMPFRPRLSWFNIVFSPAVVNLTILVFINNKGEKTNLSWKSTTHFARKDISSMGLTRNTRGNRWLFFCVKVLWPHFSVIFRSFLLSFSFSFWPFSVI